MWARGFPTLPRAAAAAFCGCVLALSCHGQEEDRPGAALGTIGAGRILVLGNSITLHGPSEPLGWEHNCGMAASAPEKDYVHVLAAGIEARTGAALRTSPIDEEPGPDGSPAAAPRNVVNIADILERQYATYINDLLQAQIDWKADIVVLQFGENVPMDTFDPDAFAGALRTLMDGLKDSSAPHVFVTSQVLRAGGAIDEIKKQVCAEDPSNRVYVDLSGLREDPTNFASSEPFYSGVIVGHPGDKGMAVIADALLKAVVHAADDQSAPPAPAEGPGDR